MIDEHASKGRVFWDIHDVGEMIFLFVSLSLESCFFQSFLSILFHL